MALEQLLGDVAQRTFIDEFFLRLPFSLPVTGTAASLSREELEVRFREIAEELASDVHASLTDPALISAFVDSLGRVEG